jgi:hypothetical protein
LLVLDEMFDKHERFMSHLARLAGDWGLVTNEWPRANDPRTDPMRFVNLTTYFRRGINDAEVAYQNRKYHEDDPQYDDYFTFSFDPSRFDYKALVNDVFERYVEWFGAYTANIGNEELAQLDFDAWKAWRKSGANDRNDVFSFDPVCYFDKELCARAFRLAPEAVAARVSPEVERTALVSDGVLIIANSKIVTVEEAKRIDRQLKAVLLVDQQRSQTRE